MKPKLRIWGKVSGVVAFVAYAIAKSGYELSISESLAYAALPALPFLVASIILYRETKMYDVQILEWKILSTRNWIAYHEKVLAEGQPWFDDDDPEEWVFEHKRAIANSKDRLEELQGELDLHRSPSSAKSAA